MKNDLIPRIRLFLCVIFLLGFANSARAQSVTLSATSVAFGSVAVGSSSAARNVTLTNTSTTTALSVTSITPSGPFTDTSACATVAAGKKCTISITFTPTAASAQTGNVVIVDSASTSPQTITLTGTGIPAIALTPASHGFGSVGEGTSSATSVFTVKNSATSAVPLTISVGSPFAQATPTTGTACGASVAASSSCTIGVAFDPTASGPLTGTLSVVWSGTGSPKTSALTGTGVTPITITPTARSFGNVMEGVTSAAKTFTVKNNTTAAMPVTFTPSSTEFADTGCSSPLAAGASCTLSVTFTPTATATGTQSGTVTVGYTGTGDPLSVTVEGTAARPITVAPTSIAFSTTRNVGTASAIHSVTITNGSTSSVALGAIVASPAAYAITANTCSTSVAAAGTCTVSVVFTPTVIGTTTGTLTIPYGSSGDTLTVSMTGGAQVNNLKSIAITMPSSSLAAGLSEQLTATGTYASGATGNVTSVAVWSSSSTAIGTVVSATGMATGVTAGNTTITAAVAETSGTVVSGTGTLTVTGKTLTGITLTGTQGSTTPVAAPTLAAGASMQIYATGTYSDGSSADITSQATWASSSTSVVVTAGLITANSTGDPTVSASLLGITGSTSVTVTAAALQSIAITPLTATIASGATQQFTATGTYTNNTTQNITSSVTWSAGSGSGVTISGAGLATATTTAVGTTVNISAALGSVSAAAPAMLSVTSAALTSIVLTGTLASVTPVAPPTLAAGTNLQLYATGVYSDGSSQDITAQATWASSGPGATVVAGMITAVSTGDPTISATLSGITGSTVATVTAPTLQSIAITPLTAAVAAGNSQQFTATGTYSDKSTQLITTTVTWNSSEPSVTMSTTTLGLATTTTAAIATNASISASLGAVTSATPATLTVNPAALVSIAVTPANASIALGTTEAFTATGTYSDGTTQNLTGTVTWSAVSGGGTAAFNNTTSPNVAQATAQGAVTITATSSSISGSTSLTVTAPVLASIIVTSVAPAIPPVAGTPAVVKVYQGQTQQFYALGTYSDSSIQNITGTVAWSAGTGSVATVSTSGPTAGLATAVAGGTVAISATSNSIVSTTTGGDGSLTVIGLTSVAVTPATPTVTLGDANTSDPFGSTNDTLQFIATATYADGTTGPGPVTTSATWTSATGTVASISNAAGTQGLATVLTAGTSLITATYSGLAGSTTLTVSPAILESITVAPAGVTLGLNGTQQFTATGNYSDGTSADITSTATWSSGNTEYVTVGTAGTTPATTPGLATVVALPTSNGAFAISASMGSVAADGATNTAFVSTNSALPIVCSSPTIDMKLLVINDAEANGGAGYADFPAVQQILNYVGTPYTVVDVSAAAPTLSDGACHGYYQGVIFAYGGDYYNISAWQSTLISYEQTFNVRQLNWYDFPDPNYGLSYTGTQIADTATYTTSFTAAAAPVFFYANTATPLTITNAAVDLATVDAAAGGTLTPLLQDSSGNIVSAIYDLNGQQFLTQTFDSNQYLMHDLIVAYGLLNWVTKGVFLGDYHVYATQEIDDFFIDDSEWIPSTTCLTNLATKDRTLPDASNLPVFRVDAADMTQLVAWQAAKQADPLLSPGTIYETGATSGKFELTIAMNGVGTSGNGDWSGLTAPIISSSASGGVATFTAQDFTGQPGQSVTITNTTNGGGVLNGTWTINPGETSSAATTPGTTTFTVNITNTETLAAQAEKGADDNTATATASVADDLVGNLSTYQGNFHWISHTYNHPTTLNGLCQSTPTGTGCGDIYNSPATDDIDLEVLTNRWVASDPSALAAWDLDTDTIIGPYDDGALKQLTFTDFNSGNIVTPGVTGLNDLNVPSYLYNDGIRYAVSDTSVATTTDPANNNGPNPSPNVGIVNSYEPGIYEVPRHPNDVFYNVANWGDDDAEFVCIYSNYVAPTAPAGTVPAPDPPFNTYNAAQVLDFTSSAFVNNMLIGDMDPEMFHQPDLHFSDNYANLTNSAPSGTIPASVTAFLGTATTHVSSLISDTYDLTFSKYEAVYKLPVLTPTLDQLAVLMQNRNSFNLSGVTASIVGAGTASATITITMPSTAGVPTATIPVTGLNYPGYFEVYGTQNISHIPMTAGQITTLPLPATP
jgi:hypothetical protein